MEQAQIEKLGYSHLRPQQDLERAVKRFVEGRNVSSLLTGSGKSLCYCTTVFFLPYTYDELTHDGLSTVHLAISLMTDQVRAMRERERDIRWLSIVKTKRELWMCAMGDPRLPNK